MGNHHYTTRYGVIGFGGWKNWVLAMNVRPWRLTWSVKLDWREFLVGWDLHNWIDYWSFDLHPLPMFSFGLIYRYKREEKVRPWLADARLQKK